MIPGVLLRVLSCFYRQDVCSFVEICKSAGYATDLGGYYVRQLQSGGYISKASRGQYQLTVKGKQILARHYGKSPVALTSRFAVLIIGRHGDSYVVLERKAQPFIDIVEWPAGIINFGETCDAALKRLALSRFGCEVQGKQAGFFRRIDYFQESIFDDKLFLVYTCDFPQNVALPIDAPTGIIRTYQENKLQTLPNKSQALLDILHFSRRSDSYAEHSYSLDRHAIAEE